MLPWVGLGNGHDRSHGHTHTSACSPLESIAAINQLDHWIEVAVRSLSLVVVGLMVVAVSPSFSSHASARYAGSQARQIGM